MATDRPRGAQTAGDLVRSLAVVLAVVAVVLFLNLRDEPERGVREVEWAGTLQQARSLAPYAVAGPVGLGDRWRATSVRVRDTGGPVTWHIGFVTPTGRYAGLEQADGPAKRFVAEFADGADDAGQVRLSGRRWQRLEGGEPEPRALVRTQGDVTTLVAGDAGWDELEELARSLRQG